MPSYPKELAQIINEGGCTEKQTLSVDKAASTGRRYHEGPHSQRAEGKTWFQSVKGQADPLVRGEVMTNLDSILKSRDITLPTNVHLGKAMVFPVVMYGCESWTVKKDERQRIDAFELWC